MKTTLAGLIVLAGFTAIAADPADGDWIDLLADGSFAAWSKMDGSDVGEGWTLVDGVAHRSGLRPGNIVTRTAYEDFELRFEWKISKAGNSGVKYRADGSIGLEYQVLDDDLHKDGKIPSHRAASLYDLVAAPDTKPIRPVGEWNTARIVARGAHLEHWLNGTKVVTIDQSSDDWNQRFAESKYTKYENFGTGAGKILLQDHADEVWFRNIRIRPLED